MSEVNKQDQYQSTRRIRPPPAPPCAREPVVLEAADVGYPGAEPLIRGVNLGLKCGTWYGIYVKNDAGKSTLNEGAVRRVGAERVSCGVFTQDLATGLPTGGSGLAFLGGLAPALTREEIRTTLGAAGIRGGAAMRGMRFLCCAEQARVALVSFAVQSHNGLESVAATQRA